MSGSAVLHIIGGNDRGKQHEITGAETRIGRGTDQDLVLADIAVSRRHVTIHQEGGRYRLKDLGSGNGSLVNGQRQDSIVLNDGDQIEIGNTMLRFDHPPSRPMAGAAPPPAMAAPSAPAPPAPSMGGLPPAGGYAAYPPGYAPPPGYPPPGYPPPGYQQPSGAYGAPPPAYPQGYPPQGYPPQGYPPPGYPPPAYPQSGYPPSYGGDPNMPPAAAPSYVGPPAGVRPRDEGGGGVGRIIAFVLMGIISVGGSAIIITRLTHDKPSPATAEAEDFYRQGLRLFAAGDFELAKVKFNDVVQLATDAPEPRRYARLCDAEMTAKGAQNTADRALTNHRYVEAVRALDAIEPTSVYYETASRERHDAAPKAAAELVEEARRLVRDNPDEAKSRAKAALDLDPDSADARDLLSSLGGAPPAVATPLPAPTTPVTPHAATSRPQPAPSAATVAAVTPKDHAPHAAKKSAPQKDDDDDLVAVKTARQPKGAVPDSKAGMAAYKARDFAGAATAFRQESRFQQEKQAVKTLDFANDITELQKLVDKATADESKAPAQAVKEYDQAVTMDQKISRGALGSYFKGRIATLGVTAAKQAFADGKYDQALQAATAATKSGADASAVMKQLESKAADYIKQGNDQKTMNAALAKQLWRKVLTMVPAGSPSYTKAYTLLNNATPQKRDEDED